MTSEQIIEAIEELADRTLEVDESRVIAQKLEDSTTAVKIRDLLMQEYAQRQMGGVMTRKVITLFVMAVIITILMAISAMVWWSYVIVWGTWLISASRLILRFKDYCKTNNKIEESLGFKPGTLF